jgi:hypothetical protein
LPALLGRAVAGIINLFRLSPSWNRKSSNIDDDGKKVDGGSKQGTAKA